MKAECKGITDAIERLLAYNEAIKNHRKYSALSIWIIYSSSTFHVNFLADEKV